MALGGVLSWGGKVESKWVSQAGAGLQERSMPDKRSHRGPHPEDARLFAGAQWPILRAAVADLSLLLGKGYAEKSALKLVGDHFGLTERQRIAVMRCSCSDHALAGRLKREVMPDLVGGRELVIDGYNVLTTVEAALAGGVVIRGRDGCYRDMASMHGTFRKVRETVPALCLIGEAVASLKPQHSHWLLDSPVSNSGRLRSQMRDLAAEREWPWEIELVTNPDAVLAVSAGIIATADSVVLDRCRSWLNLARFVLTSSLPNAGIIDLAPEPC